MAQRRTRILLRELVEVPIKNYNVIEKQEEIDGKWERENINFARNEARPYDTSSPATMSQNFDVDYNIPSGSLMEVEIQFEQAVTGSYEVDFGGVATSGPKVIELGSPVNAGRQLLTAQLSGAASYVGVSFAPGWNAAVKWIKARSKQWTSYELDLYEEEPIGLNIQRIEQSSVTSRAGSYTKTIKIPATKNNNKIFANLFEINVFNPSKVFKRNYDCQLQVDNDTIVQGNIQLTRCIYDESQELIEYEVQILSTVASLSDSIGSKQIYGNSIPDDNIDFSEHDHALTQANIMDSWSATTGSGYYYPMVNYSAGEGYLVFRPEDFKPVVYAKEMWDKILDRAGYTYESEFINSNLFQNLILLNGDALTISDKEAADRQFLAGWDANEDYYDASTKVWCVSPASTGRTVYSPYSKLYRQLGVIKWDDDSTSPFNDASNNYNTATGKYTVPNKGKYRFSCNVAPRFASYVSRPAGADTPYVLYSVDKYGALPYFTYTVEIVKQKGSGAINVLSSVTATVWLNTSGLTSSTKDSANVQTLNSQTYINTPEIELLADEKVWVRLRINNQYTKTYDIVGSATGLAHYVRLRDIIATSNGINSSFGVTVTAGVPIAEGDPVPMNSILPNMGQMDFISNIIKMFNLVIDESATKAKHLIVEPMKDYLQSGTTYDWTQKEDLNQPTTIERIDIINDKNVLFTYTDDKDDLNDQYQGSPVINRVFGQKQINNIDAEPNKFDTIQLTFSPTPSDELNKSNNASRMVVPSIYDTNEGGNLVSGFAFNDRILYRCGSVKIPANSYGWRFVSSTESTKTFGPNKAASRNFWPCAHHTDNPYNSTLDLNFGKSKYYYHSFNSGSAAVNSISGSQANITDNNLYEVYWKSYINQIVDPNSKKVTKYFKLDTEDIINFKFSNVYYVDHTAYSVNKIIDYDPNNPITKVELYRLAEYNTKNNNNSINKLIEADEWINYGELGKATWNDTPWYVEIPATKEWTAVSGSEADKEIEIYERADANYIGWQTRGYIVGSEIYAGGINTGVFALGREMTIEGNTVDVVMMNASGSVIGDSVEGGIIMNSRNSNILAGSSNVTIIGGDGITNTGNDETILGGRVVIKEQIIQESDVIDGSEDEVQELYTSNIINLIDGGEDEVRSLGSFTVVTINDPGEIITNADGEQ